MTTTTAEQRGADWAGHALRPQRASRSDAQTMTHRTLCNCGSRDGWSRLDNPWDDDVWVCPRCGGPSRVAEEKSVGLAYFRGGPLDGTAYPTEMLVKEVGLAAYITEYNWTPELVTSEQTGATARVWVHKDSVQPEMNVAPHAQIEEPGEVPAQKEEEVTESSAPAASGGDTGGGGTAAARTTPLLERRQALKVSRPEVSKRSGLTVPQVARIEFGGKRTTAEETQAYINALDNIAQEQNGGGSNEPTATEASPTPEAADGESKEDGDTGGPSAPAPVAAAGEAQTWEDRLAAAHVIQDPGGECRLHGWNGMVFVPRDRNDMACGTPCRVTTIPRTSFTFVAFTRNKQGVETVEVWDTRRRRIRYVRPEAVISKRKPRARLVVAG